jgi:hypothetical protein
MAVIERSPKSRQPLDAFRKRPYRTTKLFPKGSSNPGQTLPKRSVYISLLSDDEEPRTIGNIPRYAACLLPLLYERERNSFARVLKLYIQQLTALRNRQSSNTALTRDSSSKTPSYQEPSFTITHVPATSDFSVLLDQAQEPPNERRWVRRHDNIGPSLHNNSYLAHCYYKIGTEDKKQSRYVPENIYHSATSEELPPRPTVTTEKLYPYVKALLP